MGDRSSELEALGLARVISRKFTRIEILKLLGKLKILVKGSLTSRAKDKLLIQSLREADSKALTRFIEFARKYSITKQLNFNGPKSVATPDLHKEFIGSKVEKFFTSGDFTESVRVAFVRINKRVKKLAASTLDGAGLMRNVFSRNRPVLPLNLLQTREDEDEQEGLMHLFEGVVLAFRNPSSHDDERIISEVEARQILGFASYLMGVLDRFNLNQA